MTRRRAGEETVLVGVLKSTRDLGILLREKWYRIPVAYVPKRRFDYLAFYEPARFGPRGRRIRYYARVVSRVRMRRLDLLPDETVHPDAHKFYVRLRVGAPKELSRPIRNVLPRRVSFGFTTLNRLLTARNILQLYGVTQTEDIVKNALRQSGIRVVPQYYFCYGKRGARKRYCLDFAIFCKRGSIAIECDNRKAHSGAREKRKDRLKDMTLRRHGWTVIRLAEESIISDLHGCLGKVGRTIRALGGLRPSL